MTRPLRTIPREADEDGPLREDKWIMRPRPNEQASIRLFCFPFAGGGSYIFRDWPNYLPAQVEVCAVQLPGRGNRMRDPLCKRLIPLVKSLAKELGPYLDRPFALFGHSMGAALAFEFARLLRDEYGLEPVHLFISGHRAPHIPYPGPTTYHLPEPEFIAALRSLKGTPEEILENPEMMQLLMPLLRSDFELIQTYELVPGPPLKCAFTALGGVADQEVERSHLAEWRHHTSGRFSTQVFPGDHFFLLKARRLLLQVISQRLMNS